MFATSKTRLMLGALAVGLGCGFAAAAVAQNQATPKNWNYEIKDGKRVPKANRVENPDGSWKEEVRQGNCVTVKEKTAAGEVKVVRRCD